MLMMVISLLCCHWLLLSVQALSAFATARQTALVVDAGYQATTGQLLVCVCVCVMHHDAAKMRLNSDYCHAT
jgi:hypothetical protein